MLCSWVLHRVSTSSIADEAPKESFPTDRISSRRAEHSLPGWPVDTGSPVADQTEEKYQAHFAAGYWCRSSFQVALEDPTRLSLLC